MTNCYAAAANCSPSRTGLMTGRTPYRVGIHNWIPAFSPMHVGKEEITVATLLRQGGYDTCHVGKWHLSGGFYVAGQPLPSDHGFNYWFSTQNNALPCHHNPDNFIRNHQPAGPLEGFSAPLVVDEAILWLSNVRNRDKQFFLFVCLHEPHEPIASAKQFTQMYPSEDPSLSAHHGNVTQEDDAFGRLMAAIDKLSLRDETFVMFTSGVWQWKLNSCWPGVGWQIYDWYLKPMASYYSYKSAFEPLHVQLNPLDGTVTIVNRRLQPASNLDVRASVFDNQTKLVWEKRATSSIGANTYRDTFAIPPLADLTPVYFVKLQLTQNGKPAAENFYWLSSQPYADIDADLEALPRGGFIAESTKNTADFSALAQLPMVKLDVSRKIENHGDETVAHVQLKNSSDKLAFFVQLAITKGRQSRRANRGRNTLIWTRPLRPPHPRDHRLDRR